MTEHLLKIRKLQRRAESIIQAGAGVWSPGAVDFAEQVLITVGRPTATKTAFCRGCCSTHIVVQAQCWLYANVRSDGQDREVQRVEYPGALGDHRLPPDDYFPEWGWCEECESHVELEWW